MTADRTPDSGAPVTASQAFGEVVWLISQSRLHRDVKISSLSWLVMPAIARKQFHLFRDAGQPVGVALWASVDATVEQKLLDGLFVPGNELTTADWSSGDRLWLVDLVAPFATSANRHREIMFGDLLAGRLKGRAFKMHQADPVTGKSHVVEVPADAGARLSDALNSVFSEAVQ